MTDFNEGQAILTAGGFEFALRLVSEFDHDVRARIITEELMKDGLHGFGFKAAGALNTLAGMFHEVIDAPAHAKLKSNLALLADLNESTEVTQ